MYELNLKNLRGSMGLSLKDIAEKTRISTANLSAIEEGNFAALPPPVYARSFIRKYADVLGVDSAIILQNYEGYLLDRQEEGNFSKAQSAGAKTGKKKHWLIAALILAAIIVSLFSYYGGSIPWKAGKNVGTAGPPSKAESAPGGKGEDIAGIANPPSTQAGVRQKGESHATGLHLVIKANELTWLRIRSDKNPPNQLLLRPKEQIERFATEFFVVDIGNAGGVDLTLDGKPLGPLGRRGEVIHLRLP